MKVEIVKKSEGWDSWREKNGRVVDAIIFLEGFIVLNYLSSTQEGTMVRWSRRDVIEIVDYTVIAVIQARYL